MQLDLTDDEHAALVRLLKHALDNDRFPHAPPRAPLKAILAKLAPPKPREPRSPPRVSATPSHRAPETPAVKP